MPWETPTQKLKDYRSCLCPACPKTVSSSAVKWINKHNQIITHYIPSSEIRRALVQTPNHQVRRQETLHQVLLIYSWKQMKEIFKSDITWICFPGAEQQTTHNYNVFLILRCNQGDFLLTGLLSELLQWLKWEQYTLYQTPHTFQQTTNQ